MDYDDILYEETEFLLAKFCGNSSGGGHRVGEVESLKRLAEKVFVEFMMKKVFYVACDCEDDKGCSDCEKVDKTYMILHTFRYKVEKAFDDEKKHIDFLGRFIHSYIQNEDKVYSSDESDDEHSDGSIVLDFYPSSDEEEED